MPGAVKLVSDLWVPFVPVTVRIYGYLTMLWFSLFFSNLVVPITVDYSPEWHHPPHLTSSPLLHNLLLLSLFTIQHSTMPREAVKKVLQRFLPERHYTILYSALSSIILNIIFFCWQPMPAIVWEVPWPALKNIIIGLIVLTWIGHGVVVVMFMDTLKYSKHKLITTGMFGVVRHPIYTTIMMGMWITPIMTIGHLLIATMFTAYTVLAVVYYEEPELVRRFGSDYLKYKETVPSAFFPVPSLFRQSTKKD